MTEISSISNEENRNSDSERSKKDERTTATKPTSAAITIITAYRLDKKSRNWST
jgi:hypothetical protein